MLLKKKSQKFSWHALEKLQDELEIFNVSKLLSPSLCAAVNSDANAMKILNKFAVIVTLEDFC